jgi:AraC family transcriptional regulator
MSPRRVPAADENAGTPIQSMSVQPSAAGRSVSPKPREASAWCDITGTWRPLYGSFFQQGISVEWHDFTLAEDMDWSRSFHAGGLEICLNFSGAARLYDGAAVRELPPGALAIYTTREQAPSAVRFSGSVHRFLTLEIAPDFLRTQCAGRLELLKAPLRRFVREGGACPPYLEVGSLTTGLLGVRQELVEPPVPVAARSAWYRAKVLEVLAQTVFCEDTGGELFCTRYKRQNRDRVERARYLLERDLENPPSLDMLAEDVECSPFYLSRIFAEEVGMGIPKFLRMKRVERAADLLRSGRMSVTEVAFTVGYSSLSAFNRAFVELMGCCPGLYPKVKIAGRQGPK